MGVLDDAIREHLDLKRRHGAGEDEVRRQEEEALGPARREVAPAESEDGDGTAEAAHADETAHAEEPELSEAIPPEAVHSDVHEEEAEPLEPGPEPVAEAHEPVADAPAPAPVEEIHEEEHVEQPELGDTPAQGVERVEEEEELGGDDDFDELEDDDGHPQDDDEHESEEDEDADMLEDTPDFLQETPEHDRLWFEQKPPRDFDFD